MALYLLIRVFYYNSVFVSKVFIQVVIIDPVLMLLKMHLWISFLKRFSSLKHQARYRSRIYLFIFTFPFNLNARRWHDTLGYRIQRQTIAAQAINPKFSGFSPNEEQSSGLEQTWVLQTCTLRGPVRKCQSCTWDFLILHRLIKGHDTQLWD